MSEYKHSSESTEYGTPFEFIEAARETMGGIDLDPASSVEFNQNIVMAKRIYTEKTNGLLRKWSGRVWLNPPFGKVMPDGSPSPDGKKGISSQSMWVDKCGKEWKRSRDVKEMVTLFNAATSQKWFAALWPWRHHVQCFPFRRLAFLDPINFEPIQGNQYASVIVHWGRTEKAHLRFYDAFYELGVITREWNGGR